MGVIGIANRVPLAEKSVRNHRLGIVLLSTLVSVLLLSSMIAVLQVRAQGNLRSLVRLEKLHREAPYKDAVFERLRGLVADAMTAEVSSAAFIPLDGTLFSITEGGIVWNVQVNDVDGLIDIYLAPPAVLSLLPSGASNLEQLREVGMAALPPGSRYATVPITLARFGISAGNRAALAPLVTQSAQSGAIKVEQSPVSIRGKAAQLGRADHVMGQVRKVRILISE